MKVNINYKGKSVELDIPDEKLEELVKEQKKTGWKKPVEGDVVYNVTPIGKVARSTWHDRSICEQLYAFGNSFTSKELAENIARYQSIDFRIRRRIAEICEPVDWSNTNKVKYEVGYDLSDCNLVTYWNRYYLGNGWYCDTEAHAEQIINEFKDDLIWYFTEFKDRMDG